MASLFKRKKTPEQLVKLLKEALNANPSEEETKATEQSLDAVTKRLNQIKLMLYGEVDQESNQQKCSHLAELLLKEKLMTRLIADMALLSFEGRKHVAQIYNNLMRRDLAGFVTYVSRSSHIIPALIKGYESPDVALNCGSMLRESIRHELLAKQILESDSLWKFAEYVHLPNFDIASDAFATFKDLLTRHKAMAAAFLDSHFDEVFEKYNNLLMSENYVTRRQSLKLLGEILLDRANFDVMMRYISKKDNLKMMMNLLRDRSANIQFEAFHVFKVFVANPKKPEEITQILLNNKEKLIAYLQTFHNDKEDEQFTEEKLLLINTLNKLTLDTAPKAPAEATAGEPGQK